MERIRDLDTLRAMLGEPKASTAAKIQTALTAQAREFIARSPLMMLSTADAHGEPTISPKGDAPGFVHVHDERTLYIPERRGNNLIFGFQNILRNPQVGLLFGVPGTCETLRVQGEAELVADDALCQRFAARGVPALLVTVVHVRECYFHCAKAFMRGQIWEPETWAAPVRVSMGREKAANLPMTEAEIAQHDAEAPARLRATL